MIPTPQCKYFLAACIAAGMISSLHGQSVSHGISAAQLKVVQNDTNNTSDSVTVTLTKSVNDFRLRPGSNRGDYNVQIGDSSVGNETNGIMMACVTEHLRDDETGFGPVPGIAQVDYNESGLFISTSAAAGLAAGSNPEHNINAAAAWFPYPKWLGAIAKISSGANGGASVTNDMLVGNPLLVYGTHYIDKSSGGGVNAGKSIVDLRSLGIDSRTSGLLLVTGAKNESANFALSQPNTSNGTWNLFVRDTGSTGVNGETDPVAFVFVPKTNTTVISGRFLGNAAIDMYSGNAPGFTVARVGIGQYELKLTGRAPSSGVLVISGEGGGTTNYNHIVNYETNSAGDGWIIESRRTPSGALETPGPTEGVVSFVFVPTAIPTTLVSPTQNAEGVALPNLQAAISNGASASLTVKFFGRNAGPNTDFSIVALPDTQYYTDSARGGSPSMYYSQTEWIIAHRVAWNIPYVVHLGDIVDHGDNNGGNPLAEWRVATNAMYRLESPTRTLLNYGIPYGTAVGNHDQSPNGDATGTTTFFNLYFGVPHFQGRPYYAGHYGTNNDNHFDFFSAGGMDFIVLYFEYDPDANSAVLAWGNDVLRTNANRRAIVVTHYAGSPSTPSTHSAQAAAIYNALKTNANFFLMLGGHVDGEGSRVDTYNGHTVHTLISDYQFRTNGGNGEMRIMSFSPANNQVVVQSYSPWSDEYETDADSEFWFDYNMQPPPSNAAPFELLGTLSGVAPESVTSLIWSNRQHNTAYEWYVTVDDGLNTTTSPVWRFVTDADAAPVAINSLLSLTGDAPVALMLTASDADGDPLTYETNTLPQFGVLQNFDTNTGTFTFVPAHGFRGSDRFSWRASDGVLNSSTVTFNFNVIAPADTNGNSLPDAWETTYGVSDPAADTDNDGMTDLQEYFAGTNPTNSASALRLTNALSSIDGHVTLAWPAIGGVRYRVQYSNGDANGGFTGAFTDITRPLTEEMNSAAYGMPSTEQFVDDFTLTGGPPPNGARYYRIKVVQ